MYIPDLKISKPDIIDTLDKLLYLVHSDYFNNPVSPESENLIQGLLTDQIAKVLRFTDDNRSAKELSDGFFETMPAIKASLDKDLDAIFDGDPAANSKTEIVLAYPGFYAISVYRIAHELQKLAAPLLPRIMTENAHSLTGIDINAGATIGDFFFIDHGTGIVIGETCIIGSHVKIYQGVTLGALSTRGGQSLKGVKRHPSISDNVTIYAGASVLGNITIGDGCVIGSNVFITEDIPAGMKVAFVPSVKKIQK